MSLKNHIKPASDAVLNTDLSRSHEAQVIYLPGQDHSNWNWSTKSCTMFLFPHTTIKQPVWIKIMKVMTNLWLQITLESRIDAFKKLRSLGRSLSNRDYGIHFKKCLSAHCGSDLLLFFFWCYVWNYFLSHFRQVQDRYHHCRQTLLIVFTFHGLN